MSSICSGKPEIRFNTLFLKFKIGKNHSIAIKKHFKHNDYVSFKSTSGKCFVKISGLKNDTKKFPIS